MYLMVFLIRALALSPVTGPEDSDYVVAVRESDCQDPAFDPTEAVVSLFARAMRQILRDHAVRIGEGELCLRERHRMLPLVLLILLRVPFEPGLRH